MDYWPRWFALAKVDVPAQLPGPVFDHHFLCMQAAMNDLGIALAPWCLLQDDIAADRLRPLFAQPQLPTPASMRCTVPTAGGGAAQRFIDWLCGQGTEPSVAHSASKEILMSEPFEPTAHAAYPGLSLRRPGRRRRCRPTASSPSTWTRRWSPLKRWTRWPR